MNSRFYPQTHTWPCTQHKWRDASHLGSHLSTYSKKYLTRKTQILATQEHEAKTARRIYLFPPPPLTPPQRTDSTPTTPPSGPTSTWRPSPSDSSTPSRRYPARSTASTASRPRSQQTRPASRPHAPHHVHPSPHPHLAPRDSRNRITTPPVRSGETAQAHRGAGSHQPPSSARCCSGGRGTSWRRG